MTEAKPSSQGKDSCSLEACLSGFNSAYLIRTFLPTGAKKDSSPLWVMLGCLDQETIQHLR